jgi:hypothetical protein
VSPGLARPGSACVTVIAGGKRVFPIRFAAHASMDRMCLWFLRRFVSPDAVSLLIRHFIVETNLLNFCVRNSGMAGLAEASLRQPRWPALATAP